MIATYAPRATVHPDRYGGARPLPPKWIVLHTSEGPTGDQAAEGLARYMGNPGDRPLPGGGRYGSSYHAVADTDLTVIPCVYDNLVSYSAPGANTEGLHICIPGTANQTRDQWLTGSTREAIRTVAAFIVDRRDLYGIPCERLSVAELQAGTRGYCDHAAIRDAFGRTTHHDVGRDFPWDVLAAHIADFQQPEPTEETDNMIINYYAPDWTAFYLAGGRISHIRSGRTYRVLERGSTAAAKVTERAELLDVLAQFPCDGPPPPIVTNDPELLQAWRRVER